MQKLLVLEKEAEVEETGELLSNYSFKELEKFNRALTKLFIKSVGTGVYGRVLLHLTRAKSAEGFSKLRSTFSPGDIVGLYQSGGSNAAEAEGLI
jgi:hypothetical protein